MTLTYRGAAYLMNSTDTSASTDLIECQYRGISYRVQPASLVQPQPHHLQYRGVQY